MDTYFSKKATEFVKKLQIKKKAKKAKKLQQWQP